MCSVATSTAIPPSPPPHLSRPHTAPLVAPTQLDTEGDDVVVVTKKRRTSSTSRWDSKEATVELRKQAVRDAVATAHQAFRCPICLDTFGEIVVECAECAHVFCDPCMRESLKRKDKCPLCRCNPMPLRRCKPIERLVAALPEACAFLDNGCIEVSLTRATAFRHSLTCGFARFTCPHCRHVFLRHEHDEGVCSSELHACPLAALGCSFRGRNVDMDAHVKDRIHFDLARRVLKGASQVVPTSDMAIALRALLDISTTAWKDTAAYDDDDETTDGGARDDVTERARLEFVHAMLASNIVPPPA